MALPDLGRPVVTCSRASSAPRPSSRWSGAAGCGDNSGGNTIAVIGGGIAGMTCAHFLGLAGVHAEIYEASMRIGGRQFTSRGQLADDQICELGGELVDSDHAVIPMLVESYGLTLDDLVDATPGLAQDSFFFDGALVSDAALAAAFAPVAAQMQTALTAMANDDAEYARIDALSIPEWLAGDARLVPTDLVRRVLELAYLEEFGLEVEQQSAWNLITLIDSATTEPFHVFGDSDERFHIHEGSDAIATAMATELGDQVHLDHALTKVTEAEGMFELTFVTSAGTSTGFLLDEPLNITASIASARISLAEDSPNTQRTDSITFDLPQPFGPTTPTRCPCK